MLNRIILFSLRNRVLVISASILLAILGMLQGLRMPVDVLPDLNRPTVVVMAEAHAMVPEDIERFISRPLEQVLNGATDVTKVRSASGMGLSMITVEFGWKTDIYRNRQIVQEKLQLARRNLPSDVEPHMTPVSSIMGQIQIIGIQSKSGNTSIEELRALADYRVKIPLLSVPGVAQVISSGGAARQLQVIVDSDKLSAFGVTLEEAATAIRESNHAANGGIMNVGVKGTLITVSGLLTGRETLENAVVKDDAQRPLLIKDIARVEFGPSAVRSGEAGINGQPGVLLVIMKQPGIDTVSVTNAVNRELDALRSAMPEDVVIHDDVFQQAAFIHRAIDNVADAIFDGAILVVIILFLFLFNLRTTFITLTAIPLSIAMTAIIFTAFGQSINTMTLGGLAVAIGALVDDAIVDVENVFRRLRENSALKDPKNPLLVIFKASSEVRKPILIGTLLVIVVYIPLFFLSGLEGKLFAPIGLAYIISILCSLVVSLTITPALCFYLLGRKNAGAEKETITVRLLQAFAAKAIRFSVQNPFAVLGSLLASVAVALFVLLNAGTEFLPSFNEGVAQVNLFLPPGTGLKTSDEYGKRLEKLLAGVEGVKYAARRSGRAEGDEHVHDVNFSEAIVTFDSKSSKSRKEIVDEIRAKLAEEFPGVPTEVDQPLSHLLSHMLSGVKAQVAVKIIGPDLEVLRRTAKKVEDALRPVPGVTDLFAEQQTIVDQIVVNPRRDLLARAGVTVEQVAELVELAFEGEELSQLKTNQISFPIILRLEEKDRRNMEDIVRLRVKGPDGKQYRLGDLADVRIAKTPNNINRENVSRLITVQHNVAGRSLGDVVADVEKALEPIRAELSQTPGYSIRIGGQFEAQQEAAKLIVMLSFLSLILMFLLLFMHFKSVNLSLQVLMSIPMAFIGAVAYVTLTGQIISVSTMVGFISLGGIAARNAILLIDHYIHLMREEKEPFGIDMIIRAGQERMVPVLMTALTSGIALVPLVLAPDEPGREVLYPVATVILGGLISSTLLDFVVSPALFFLVGARDAKRIAAAPENKDRATEELIREFETEHTVNHKTLPVREEVS